MTRSLFSTTNGIAFLFLFLFFCVYIYCISHRYRQGLQSQYTFENVAIVPGGKLGVGTVLFTLITNF